MKFACIALLIAVAAAAPTKTQSLTSKVRGMHSVSTTFTGLGAGASCKVAVQARQTDYDWKRTEWLQVHAQGAKYQPLNANCGFTKQCSHAMSKCNLVTSTVKADSNGKLTIRATHSRGVNYCAYKGYYMYAQVSVTCKSTGSKYDVEGRLMANGGRKYSAKGARACCARRCRRNASCKQGCSLWLSTSSLNYESRAWQGKLRNKCMKDCSMPRLWKSIQHPKKHFFGHWSTLTVSNERLCKLGCRNFAKCA